MSVPATKMRNCAEEPIVTAAGVRRPVVVMIDEFLRRTIDLTLCTLSLILLFPLFLALAIAIKMDSPGPVLFIQKRVGKDGVEFPFFKFRSMYIDSEERRAALLVDNEATGPLFKMKQDPRITKVGRLIRRSSIDELPQLLNVLRGEMTLVGPRPALPVEVATYSDKERQRLVVTPGLTGLWQVSGRSDLSFEQAIHLDLEYIRRRSVLLDVEIMAKTIPAVVAGRGAY
ncbi:MAG: sugar transferase [Capsulimonas sp.]|uniref:sugar transferase n=1 Tax=Capsulimonas sp. TaxID=2494211 RepID=UPI0032633892